MIIKYINKSYITNTQVDSIGIEEQEVRTHR